MHQSLIHQSAIHQITVHQITLHQSRFAAMSALGLGAFDASHIHLLEIPSMAVQDRDDPFERHEKKLNDEYYQMCKVLNYTNVENGIDMNSADLSRTSLQSMRHLKDLERQRASRLDPDLPIDAAALSKANPSIGIAAGRYMCFIQKANEQYENMRVQALPTDMLVAGVPTHIVINEIRSIEAELQEQKLQQQLAQRQEQERQRDEQRRDNSNHGIGVRSIFG